MTSGATRKPVPQNDGYESDPVRRMPRRPTDLAISRINGLLFLIDAGGGVGDGNGDGEGVGMGRGQGGLLPG